MRSSVLQSAVFAIAALCAAAPPVAAPPLSNEHLRYAINWPSGLSLGEAELSASAQKATGDAPDTIALSFNIDAGIPGFPVIDRYRSRASGDFCSLEFERKTEHGRKKTDENLKFDPQHSQMIRQTPGGGHTEVQTSSCARDALAFLYFARRELAQGRIPARQQVYLGAGYEVRLDFSGTQSIRLGEAVVDADRVAASVKGSSSTIDFEMFFLKDDARTPALVRVPLALGTFSMELLK